MKVLGLFLRVMLINSGIVYIVKVGDLLFFIVVKYGIIY